MTRRFSPLFDASVHTEPTRRGHLRPAQIGILAAAGKRCDRACTSSRAFSIWCFQFAPRQRLQSRYNQCARRMQRLLWLTGSSPETKLSKINKPMMETLRAS